MVSKIVAWVKENIFLCALLVISFVFLAVNIRINIFSYNNFDFGKFDLGNMTQMVWNTLHGRFMYLTDYFGANVPRWAMSHVDPIILLVLPFFLIWQSPLTLIIFQLVLVIFSSVLVYFVSLEVTKSKWASFCFGLTYLFYPAVGYLTAKTAFHGVTVAIPFFFAAFLVFEIMYNRSDYSFSKKFLFWIFVVITMSGKEQLPLYIIMYGVFILLFRNNDFFSQSGFKLQTEWARRYFSLVPVKMGLMMIFFGIVWFITAFFIIIPKYASYRSIGYDKFAEKIGINQETARDVALDNYFLSRYSEFGDSYSDVILGIISNPQKVIKIAFDGDKEDNFVQTFAPLGYIPFLYPQISMIAVPDLLINYMTGADAGGISEIYNHRISMIIPVLILSVLYFYVAVIKRSKKLGKSFRNVLCYALPTLLVVLTIYTSSEFGNPVYLWLKQALSRRFPTILVQAKYDLDVAKRQNLEIGKSVKISPLESRDRECAHKIVETIPDNASVSGPDFLGSHLGMRETYAIFPALYDEADYVIVDVFSRKIFTVLGINHSMLKQIVREILKDPNYSFELGCGNMFVYKKRIDPSKDQLLPIQERLEYEEVVSYPIQEGIIIVDYSLPQEIEKGNTNSATFTYKKDSGDGLDNYILFMSLLNKKTGEIYQMANLPSFGLFETDDWEKGKYYIETVDFVIPDFVESDDYMFFIGATNTLKSSSIYLGDIKVL